MSNNLITAEYTILKPKTYHNLICLQYDNGFKAGITTKSNFHTLATGVLDVFVYWSVNKTVKAKRLLAQNSNTIAIKENNQKTNIIEIPPSGYLTISVYNNDATYSVYNIIANLCISETKPIWLIKIQQ